MGMGQIENILTERKALCQCTGGSAPLTVTVKPCGTKQLVGPVPLLMYKISKWSDIN